MKPVWDERPKILVVAPECRTTRAMIERLRRYGFAVDHASTAAQAFARVDYGAYAVVLGHGSVSRGWREFLREFAGFVRRRRPGAALIEVSGCKGSEDVCEPAPFRVRVLRCSGVDIRLARQVADLVVQAADDLDDGSSWSADNGGHWLGGE
ncbi:MAG: hypothetical protein KatS3mg077_1517 [Candidatus Binatia bacterium]|nr:MAG: hypothetical protein KatS3mg077_1517 [Candidatus Binatia bacterium]